MQNVRNVAEDVRDLAAHINENGNQSLDLDGFSREQSEKVNVWDGETEVAIHVINENCSGSRRGCHKAP